MNRGNREGVMDGSVQKWKLLVVVVLLLLLFFFGGGGQSYEHPFMV